MPLSRGAGAGGPDRATCWPQGQAAVAGLLAPGPRHPETCGCGGHSRLPTPPASTRGHPEGHGEPRAGRRGCPPCRDTLPHSLLTQPSLLTRSRGLAAAPAPLPVSSPSEWPLWTGEGPARQGLGTAGVGPPRGHHHPPVARPAGVNGPSRPRDTCRTPAPARLPRAGFFGDSAVRAVSRQSQLVRSPGPSAKDAAGSTRAAGPGGAGSGLRATHRTE